MELSQLTTSRKRLTENKPDRNHKQVGIELESEHLILGLIYIYIYIFQPHSHNNKISTSNKLITKLKAAIVTLRKIEVKKDLIFLI